jgi:hypothetical protein
LLVAAALDQEHLAMIRSIGMRSALIVPLAVRGRSLGALTFVHAESGDRFDRTDLASCPAAHNIPIVLVILAAYSRITGRMLPTRRTEDLLLDSWELIGQLGRSARRLIWDNEAPSDAPAGWPPRRVPRIMRAGCGRPVSCCIVMI